MDTENETLFLIDHDWNESFSVLKTYLQEGLSVNSIDIATKYQGVSIGLWCRLQCKLKDTGRLPESRVEMLNGIQFDFNMINNFRKKAEVLRMGPEQRSNTWNELFECVEKFIQIHSRTPRSIEVLDGKPVGTWLCAQRYRLGKLSPDKREKLNNLPVPLESVSETKWKGFYAALLEYQKEFGTLPKYRTTYRGLEIGYWFSCQRCSDKRGDLDPSKVELLLATGALFESSKDAA